MILETANPAKFLEEIEKMMGWSPDIPATMEATNKMPEDFYRMDADYEKSKTCLIQKHTARFPSLFLNYDCRFLRNNFQAENAIEATFPTWLIRLMSVRGRRRDLAANVPAAVASQISDDRSRCQSDNKRSRLASLCKRSCSFCKRSWSNSFL